jgi:hypothetical protein
MISPFRYSFTNYFDLKQIERTGTWAEKEAAKAELESREGKKKK